MGCVRWLSHMVCRLSIFRKTCADASLIFQVANVYIFKTMLPSNAYMQLLVTLLLIAPINVIGVLIAWLLPKNQDMYLDNVVLAQKASS